jgi:glycine/serine hydroxymethyltransferase
MGVPEMKAIGGLMVKALRGAADPGAAAALREEVRALCRRFPLPYPRIGAAA